MSNLDDKLSQYMTDHHPELSGELKMSSIISYMHSSESKEGVPLLFSDIRKELTPHQLFCAILAADALSIENKLPQLLRRFLSALHEFSPSEIAEELHIVAEGVASDEVLQKLGWAVKKMPDS